MRSMSPREGQYLVKLLLSRDGIASIVTLQNGTKCRVLNITYGRDQGEQFDHITTNTVPYNEGADWDFFCSSDVREIASEDGVILFHSSAV